jgi:hypothetical protein
MGLCGFEWVVFLNSAVRLSLIQQPHRGLQMSQKIKVLMLMSVFINHKQCCNHKM